MAQGMAPDASPSDGKPRPAHRCPVCGEPNQCAPARAGTFSVECWCSRATIDAAVLARLPDAVRDQACLCPRCAGARPVKGERHS